MRDAGWELGDQSIEFSDSCQKYHKTQRRCDRLPPNQWTEGAGRNTPPPTYPPSGSSAGRVERPPPPNPCFPCPSPEWYRLRQSTFDDPRRTCCTKRPVPTPPRSKLATCKREHTGLRPGNLTEKFEKFWQPKKHLNVRSARDPPAKKVLGGVAMTSRAVGGKVPCLACELVRRYSVCQFVRRSIRRRFACPVSSLRVL